MISKTKLAISNFLFCFIPAVRARMPATNEITAPMRFNMYTGTQRMSIKGHVVITIIESVINTAINNTNDCISITCFAYMTVNIIMPPSPTMMVPAPAKTGKIMPVIMPIIVVATIITASKIADIPATMRSAFDAFFINKTSSLILSN